MNKMYVKCTRNITHQCCTMKCGVWRRLGKMDLSTRSYHLSVLTLFRTFSSY